MIHIDTQIPIAVVILVTAIVSYCIGYASARRYE